DDDSDPVGWEKSGDCGLPADAFGMRRATPVEGVARHELNLASPAAARQSGISEPRSPVPPRLRQVMRDPAGRPGSVRGPAGRFVESWWRRRESNPRPKGHPQRVLQAYPTYATDSRAPRSDRRDLRAPAREDLVRSPRAGPWTSLRLSGACSVPHR